MRNVFTTQTHHGCLAILGVASNDLCLKNSFNSLLVDGFINTEEYMELQSRSFFFDESVSRKKQRTDVIQVPDTIPDTASWSLGDAVANSEIGQQCESLAFIGIEMLLDLINNSLHWHDIWSPLERECFALWSDCTNVSFCYLNRTTNGTNRDAFCKASGLQNVGFVSLQDNRLQFHESLTDDSNLMVVPSHCRTDASLETLEAHLRGEQSNFLLNSEWKTLQFHDSGVQHAQLHQVWSMYQFASVKQIFDAWGVQIMNIKVSFQECLEIQGGFAKWRTLIHDGEVQDCSAICWLDQYWWKLIDQHHNQVCLLFGAGLIGFEAWSPKLVMPRFSQRTVIVIRSHQGTEVTIDLFSGIGGWRFGSISNAVVSVERDSAVAKIHSFQTDSILIDETNIDDIWRTNFVGASVILNFDVRDKRWWILFNRVRISFATASPPCVSWSGAAFSAGLDQEDGILFAETLFISSCLDIVKLALENVYAILGHKHWKILQALIEIVLARHLAILKLDLSMFMPMRRLRAFIFVGDVPETHVIVPQRTWFQQHIIQSGMWTPLCRACSEDLIVSESAMNAAVQAALLPVEWKNGCIEALMTKKDCLKLRTITPFDPIVPSCMSQYGHQHQLSIRLLRERGLLSFFMFDCRTAKGLRLIDPLEFAWVLGFDSMVWPKNPRTSYRILGNCVAPIMAKIANHWIRKNWFGESLNCQTLWKEIEYRSCGTRMLADCQVATNDEWVQWIDSEVHESLQILPRQRINVLVSCGGCTSTHEVSFLHGLRIEQILASLYPIDWKQFDLFFEHSLSLRAVCQGNFAVSTCDICVTVDGIGWIQVPPLKPVQSLFEAIWTQKAIDVSSFRLGIDNCFPDLRILFAAWLPRNRYYLCDALNRRFDSFLTPSVKRKMLSNGSFENLPAIHLLEPESCIHVTVNIMHSAGQDQLCITIERDSNLSYLQVANLALTDFLRKVHFEMTTPGLDLYDICRGSFDITLKDITVLVEPHGFELFSPFARLHHILDRVNRKFFAGLANLRLRLNRRPCDLDDFVGRVNDSLILRVLQFDGIGGGLPQAQLLIRLQNLLVEHGVPKAESKARAGIVWDALGSSKVSTVFATKEPWSALKQEATSKGIQLVTIAERYITESSDDAWSKYRLSQSKDQESTGKGKGKDKDNRKSRSRKWDTDVIGETTLDLTFLEGGNNSVTKISYEALEQGSAGVCILPFATVSEKRDIIFNRSFSASPAIILTIGQVEPPPGKESRCVFITIPGWLADKPVALNCTLVQVGDQPFTIPEAKEITSAIPVHTVCMIQVVREDADPSLFPSLQDGFAAYLRKLGLDSWKNIEAEWSQAFFSGKQRTNFDKCTYFHNVIRVQDKHVKSLLRLGGNSGIFILPKNSNRSIDERFKVCLLRGLTLEECKQRLHEIPHHLGIARVKAGFGIRVEKNAYQRTKKTLLPDAPSSDEEHLATSGKRFFLLGMPDGFDRNAIRKVVKEINWTVGAIVPHGWKTWSIFADGEPPVRDIKFQGAHIVIADGGCSSKTSVYAAGAVKGWKSLANLTHSNVKSSPANIISGGGTTSTSSTTGVFDSFKTETDDKIQSLESKVEFLTQDIKKRDAIHNKEIGDIKQQVQQVEQKVCDLPATFDGQISHLFERFKTENQKTIAAVERRQSQQFEELRELFQPSSKHRKTGGDSESREASRNST